VLEAVVVDAVNFLSCKLKPHFLHVAVVEPLNKHQEPHSFVGLHRERRKAHGYKQNQFLHFKKLKVSNTRYKTLRRCQCYTSQENKTRTAKINHFWQIPFWLI